MRYLQIDFLKPGRVFAVVHVLCLLLFARAAAAEVIDTPTVIVSKDSLVFTIPMPDTSKTWEWNVAPKGLVEQEWVFTIPSGDSMAVLVGLINVSKGPPLVRGKLSGLVSQAGVYMWNSKGEMNTRWNLPAPTTFSGGDARIVFYRRAFVETVVRLRPVTITFGGVRADGSRYTEHALVTNLRDPREEEARQIAGPLSPDEYAIYQTLATRALGDVAHPYARAVFVLTPTVHRAFMTQEVEQTRLWGASDEARVDYLKRRPEVVDLSSLSELGFNVMDADSCHVRRVRARSAAEWPASVRFSAIGFNSEGDEAIVYMETSVGNLGGEGTLIFLRKLDGEWLAMRRVPLWIS